MILLITNKRKTGLNYHRQIVPFRNLGLPYEERDSEDDMTDEYLSKFSMVSLLRESIDINRYKKLGIKIHFDIDDYWVLPSHHQLCKVYKIMKYAEKTIECLKVADFVTTTTEVLAERIKEYNSNVYVLPNAIDPTEEQWQINPVEISHNRLRFGYVAGAHHKKDVEMLHPELVKLYRDKSIDPKTWQLLVAGFNFTAKQDGSVEMNPYYRYVEQLFTSVVYNGKIQSLLRPELEALLCRQKLCEFRDMDDNYQRLNGADTFNYGKIYNSIDVSLVPLIDTAFNRNKSQLKMIEAGFMKKAVIVSNVIPYKLDFTDTNCLVSGDKEWHKNIKYLCNNRNKVVDLQESLYEYVNSKYHIDIVNVERKQIFEKWLA